jgi:hypothetical protein
VVWSSALTPGAHNVAFIALKDANPKSSGTLVELDAFLTLGP